MKKILFISVILIIASCSNEPQQINYGNDACDFCKMAIMDKKFATQCISTKGKVFKFDDAFCLISFLRNGGVWSNEVGGVYFTDFKGTETWLKSDNSYFLKSENLRSPMGGNIAAFATRQEAENAKNEFNGEIISWNDLKPKK